MLLLNQLPAAKKVANAMEKNTVQTAESLAAEIAQCFSASSAGEEIKENNLNVL